jgi:hypothetical protein
MQSATWLKSKERIMHAAIKAQWLTALRGGEYEQGYGNLNQGNRFCCLGVLCDLATKAGVVEMRMVEPIPHDRADLAYIVYGESSAVLPTSVAEWAGLHDHLGKLPTPIEGEHATEAYDLATVNDYLRWDFNRIADLIEEQF